jgi:hypothetical protein
MVASCELWVTRLNLHETIQGRAWNQLAAELLMTAAEAGADETVEAATMQMQSALKRDGLMR